MTDFVIKDGKLIGLIINDEEELKTEAAILAPGHSARDTFKVLSKTICDRTSCGTSA